MNESLSYRIWSWAVMGALLWWCAGFNLFIYHLTALILFLGLTYVANRYSGGLLLPSSGIFILCISVFYFLSILIHAFFEEGGGRVVASFYNLSFWIMGFMLILVLATTFSKIEIGVILRAFWILSWVTGLIAVVMLILWQKGTKNVVFYTPLYAIGDLMGRTQLVEGSLQVRPLLLDWFASASRPRLNVFSPYPTAAGGIILIILIMTITRAVIERRQFSFVFWILMAMNILGLVMTLSRMSLMAFIFSFIAVFMLQRKNVSLWLLILLITLVLLTPWIQNLLGYLLSLREDSNTIRVELYKYSLAQLDGVDWFLGYGIKPREEAFMYPIGSHSTYISMLFKCGVIGLIVWILLQGSLLLRWYQLKSLAARRRRDFLFWRGLGWVFIAMAIWVTTEDIDAPQFLAFLYFSLIGIFEGFRRSLLT